MANSFLSFFNKPAALPNEQSLSLTSPTDILGQFISQQGQIPALNNIAQTLNTDENEGVQQQIGAVDPSFMPNVSKLGTNISSMLAGQIPQDVMDQVTNSTAYQSLMGGYGGSGMAHSLTARDLGLTSLNLQQQGQQGLGTEASLDGMLTPGRATAGSMMLSPSSLQEADYTADQYNNQIANQNSLINYQNAQRVSPFSSVVANTLGSLVSTPFNFIQSGDSVVGNSPSIFAQMMAGSAAGGSSSGGGKSGGGGGGGLLGGMMGGGGGGLLALL